MAPAGAEGFWPPCVCPDRRSLPLGPPCRRNPAAWTSSAWSQGWPAIIGKGNPPVSPLARQRRSRAYAFPASQRRASSRLSARRTCHQASRRRSDRATTGAHPRLSAPEPLEVPPGWTIIPCGPCPRARPTISATTSPPSAACGSSSTARNPRSMHSLHLNSPVPPDPPLCIASPVRATVHVWTGKIQRLETSLWENLSTIRRRS